MHGSGGGRGGGQINGWRKGAGRGYAPESLEKFRRQQDSSLRADTSAHLCFCAQLNDLLLEGSVIRDSMREHPSETYKEIRHPEH